MKKYMCIYCESANISLNVWSRQTLNGYEWSGVIYDDGDCYCHKCDSESRYTYIIKETYD
jgi:hypothetical protein